MIDGRDPRPSGAATRRSQAIREQVSESKAGTEEVKIVIMRDMVSRRLLATVFVAIIPITAWLMYGDGSKPRPSSIDASIHAPLNGVELSGIVENTPVSTNGFVHFFVAPKSRGEKVVDDTVQVSGRGEAKVRLVNGLHLSGDVRATGH